MRGVALAIAAALVITASATAPAAADLGLADPGLTAASPAEHRYLLLAGYDVWRHGGSAHGGFLWSPDGINREGFTLKVLLASGLYGYRSGAQDVDGRYGLFSVMPGWRIKSGALDVKLFAGLDLQSHRLSPNDPGNRLGGSHLGVRFGGDLWYQPTPQTMVNLGVSLSTIDNSYWSRGAVGWLVNGFGWVGPEVLALGSDGTYHQLRVGVHITALRTGPFEWSFGIGHARDSEDRSGLYGRIGVLTRQ